ncbi:MAG: HAD family hydrolase [Polyangiaceae bacterium]
MPSDYTDRRVSADERRQLLRAMVAQCKHTPNEPAPVLVFDLDGTLLDNRPRVAVILRELSASWADKHPVEAGRLASAKADDIVYGLRENLMRHGVSDEELLVEGMEFWRSRFFYDAYMKYDSPLPGARDFVVACYEAGATIVYLTGRDLPNMALGTFASLRDNGFPIGVVGTSLITKPAFEIADSDFKHSVAPALVRHGHIVASFDNEPANCNLFLEHHPLARCVFLDTQHAPNPPHLDERCAVIDTFEA